jgi:hypothetical protein
MEMQSARKTTALLAQIFSLLGTSHAFACSVVNVDAFLARGVSEAGFYWVASMVLGCVIIIFESYNRRGPIIVFLTVLLLIFHPRWFMYPNYLPDCSFVMVQASQVVLAILVALLLYGVVRTFIAYRKRSFAKLL